APADWPRRCSLVPFEGCGPGVAGKGNLEGVLEVSRRTAGIWPAPAPRPPHRALSDRRIPLPHPAILHRCFNRGGASVRPGTSDSRGEQSGTGHQHQGVACILSSLSCCPAELERGGLYAGFCGAPLFVNFILFRMGRQHSLTGTMVLP